MFSECCFDQDWVFYNTNGIELTLEVHNDKKPPATTLPALWATNLPALMRLMEVVSMLRIICLIYHGNEARPIPYKKSKDYWDGACHVNKIQVK
jgi:hypothetical protein